jgi:hypothetical protein
VAYGARWAASLERIRASLRTLLLATTSSPVPPKVCQHAAPDVWPRAGQDVPQVRGRRRRRGVAGAQQAAAAAAAAAGGSRASEPRGAPGSARACRPLGQPPRLNKPPHPPSLHPKVLLPHYHRGARAAAGPRVRALRPRPRAGRARRDAARRRGGAVGAQLVGDGPGQGVGFRRRGPGAAGMGGPASPAQAGPLDAVFPSPQRRRPITLPPHPTPPHPPPTPPRLFIEPYVTKMMFERYDLEVWGWGWRGGGG